ncbi:MAG: ribosome biogenesis/translation initiation ATPase RLI [Candidatus Hydrothermarchaeales archaeon]
MRIAIIDVDRCQPKRCSKECIRFCPGVRIGDETIVFEEGKAKPTISEELCTGCGICVHKCPFEAISIVGLPDELEHDLIHQYGENGFRFYRLPYARENAVTGLIGPNAIGKTSVIRILSGEMRPNLGDYEGDGRDILEYFSGTQFHDYFEDLYDGEIKAIYKPQYVDSLPKAVEGEVGDLLEKADEKGELDDIVRDLELQNSLDRAITDVSGGELQRIAIAAALLREGEIYVFDEPSSYLDVRQRLNVGKIIRNLAREKRVLVVEHDLILLDYLADYVCMMYGKKGAYGVVSQPRTVRQGINVYLMGYLKEENIRVRKEPLRFEVRPPSAGWESERLARFDDLEKTYDGFGLRVKGGEIYKGEIVGILGPNATGKTTFVKMLAGVIEADHGEVDIDVKVSYKPQYIKPEFEGTVGEVLEKTVKDFGSKLFNSEIARPLELEYIYPLYLQDLSGGELQKVSIAMCLGQKAEIYLLDEPSAYLDVEQRLNLAKMIRRILENRKAAGIVVDHDILFTDYISDRLMVFYGEAGVKGTSTPPMEMKEGMNRFLKNLKITFRRDAETGRPRANKLGSQKDKEQKAKGEYYYLSS